MTPQDKEKLDVLSGDRASNKQNAAVRIKHAKALLDNISTEPTGDPTADIRAIYAALNAMRVALQ